MDLVLSLYPFQYRKLKFRHNRCYAKSRGPRKHQHIVCSEKQSGGQAVRDVGLLGFARATVAVEAS